MTLGDQWRKIKDNWLLIILPLVLLFLVFGGLGTLSSSLESVSQKADFAMGAPAPSFASREMIRPDGMIGGGFAPGSTDRLIAKNARLSTEVERGAFDDGVARLKSYVKTADAYILNENINKYGEDADEYRTGSFELKVTTAKYDDLTAQLKAIGEVQSFNENADDVTGFHEDLTIQLEAEKERLKRYEAMYDEAKDVEDKIQLSDRIFNQQSLIKQLENSIRDLDQRVSYSTISVTITEERSDLAGISFIGLGELAAGFVGSLSGLLAFAVAVLPWAVALWLVRLAWRKLTAKKR